MRKFSILICILSVLSLMFISFSCRHNTGDPATQGSNPGNINIPPENQSGSDDVPADISQIELSGIVLSASVNLTKAQGYLNSAYVEYEYFPQAVAYIVKVDGKNIDNQLIRGYEDHGRADAPGLKAGSHVISVQALMANGDVTSAAERTVQVTDHDRSGFAFSKTSQVIPGAYKMDGTLKDDAIVIYVSAGNAKSLTATIKGKDGSKDKTATYTGLQGLLAESNCKYYSQPVCIRIIGLIKKDDVDTATSGWSSAEGLQLKNNGKKSGIYPGLTLEGIGEDACLWGFGLMGNSTNAWEIANLGIMNFMDDGISIDSSNMYTWVHNCDFFYGSTGSDADQAKGDGTLDVKADSQYNTYSYNHFWDSGKASLCGMKSESGPNYITYHHNWFDHSDSRHPRIRTMSVHVYNNYFDGNAKYGIGVTSGASCFAEGNFFRNAHDPMMSSKQGTDANGDGTFSGEEGGTIKSWNNKFTECGSYGVKFQFITNKKDYTGKTYETGVPLGERQERTESLGSDNGDGSWTIYDSYISDTENTISENSLISINDASVKGAYYQGGAGKTMFTLSLPANALKLIVKAKCGSSGDGKTTNISVNGIQSAAIGNADYADYSFTLSLTEDSLIKIENSGSNSLNIKEIKLTAKSAWLTTLTSGADLSDIDCYEVDARNEKIPTSVKTRSGAHSYDNFDTILGDAGLGLTKLPTDPDTAKEDVIQYAGRINGGDFKWTFDNASEDANYEVITALKNAIMSYSGSLKSIQGMKVKASENTEGSSSNGSQGTDSGETGNQGDSESTSPLPENSGSAVISFAKSGQASDDRVTGASEKKYTTAQTYQGSTYTYGAKLNSTGLITLTLEKNYRVTFLLGTDKTSYSKGLSIDSSVVEPASDNIVTVNLTSGTHTIQKADSETSVFLIILE